MKHPRKLATALLFGSLNQIFLWGAIRGESIRDQHWLDWPPVASRVIGLGLYALGFALLFICLLLGRSGG